jgi:hypothetical protein
VLVHTGVLSKRIEHLVRLSSWLEQVVIGRRHMAGSAARDGPEIDDHHVRPVSPHAGEQLREPPPRVPPGDVEHPSHDLGLGSTPRIGFSRKLWSSWAPCSTVPEAAGMNAT